MRRWQWTGQGRNGGRNGAETDTRRLAEGYGRRAEWIAIWWLRLKGYRVLAQRTKTPVGEIDLILRRRDLICFVEVKARARIDDALSSLTQSQCRRIERAAEYWTRNRADMRALDHRFDLVAIAPRHRPVHLPDAWRPQTP